MEPCQLPKRPIRGTVVDEDRLPFLLKRLERRLQLRIEQGDRALLVVQRDDDRDHGSGGGGGGGGVVIGIVTVVGNVVGGGGTVVGGGGGGGGGGCGRAAERRLAGGGRGGERCPVRGSLLRILRQRRFGEGRERGWGVGADLAERGGLLVHVHPCELDRAGGLERKPAREQAVEDDTEGIDVAGSGRRLPLRLFRREIRGSAEERPRLRQRSRPAEPGGPH